MARILAFLLLPALIAGCGSTTTIKSTIQPTERQAQAILIADQQAAVAHLDSAFTLWLSGETPAALVELDLGRRADPTNWEIHHYRGLILIELGLYDEAARAQEEALAVAPAAERRLRGRIYLALGEARERNGDLIRARQHYQTALDLMPGWALASLSLARVS